MGGLAGEELVGRAVRCRGIELGRVDDVVVDLPGSRALGFVVACRDDVRRFLPFGAADLLPEWIETASALVLLDEGELRYYLRKGRALGTLRGLDVEGEGELLDVVVDERGDLLELVLHGQDGVTRVPRGARPLPASSAAPAA